MSKEVLSLKLEEVRKICYLNQGLFEFISQEVKSIGDLYVTYRCLAKRLSDNKYFEFEFKTTKILFSLKEEESYTLTEI